MVFVEWMLVTAARALRILLPAPQLSYCRNQISLILRPLYQRNQCFYTWHQKAYIFSGVQENRLYYKHFWMFLFLNSNEKPLSAEHRSVIVSWASSSCQCRLSIRVRVTFMISFHWENDTIRPVYSIESLVSCWRSRWGGKAYIREVKLTLGRWDIG